MKAPRFSMMTRADFSALSLHEKNTYLQALSDQYADQHERERVQLDKDALSRLRATFASGKTRPLDWRLQQLAELERMLREHAADFSEALQADLHKCRFETALSELGFVESEAKYARKHLRRWARAKRVPTPMMALSCVMSGSYWPASPPRMPQK